MTFRRLATWGRYLRARPLLRRVLLGIFAVLAVGLSLLTWLLFPYLQAFGDIGAEPDNQPTRLYGSPQVLRVGEAMRASRLTGNLEALGYRKTEGEGTPAGRYRTGVDQGDGRVAVRLRRRMTPEGPAPGQTLLVQMDRNRITDLRLDGQPVGQAALEAPVLATWYEGDSREKWPVEVKALPEHVVQAVLAAEDSSFYWHPGVSPTGIARAALVNLRRGEVAQGGSTLTQQLVKNVFLTHERSFFRKIREAVIALAVEAQHSKRSILQGYLNGIYLGGGHGVQYYGLGTAARAYFGKDATELTLEEAAVIAGLIKAPAAYSPLTAPEKSRERRDEVLRRMAELEWIDAARLERALATPVETSPLRLGGRRAAHFGDAMATEARERFGLKRLGNRGHHLFATLRLADQEIAEAAVAEVLEGLDRRGRRGADPLEAALVSVDPQTGALLAYVGGRDYEKSEFDRVSQAHRQAGSSMKPIVLVAALESGKASLATRLEDKPLTLKSGMRSWSPKNSDGAFRGSLTARTAMEQSRNVPLVRLAMDVGIGKVADTARRMGIESPLEEVPSLALGSAGVTPREIATVYATLASGGVKPLVHGLASVLDAQGQPVRELHPSAPERILTPQVAYITTEVLSGVVHRGTARGVLRYGISGPLAGKTGTTNEARDNWFAGYRPDRVTVVWVGQDNPKATNLSGSRAAIPIWGRFMKDALPELETKDFPEPPEIEHANICRDSGLLVLPACPRRLRESFLPGQKPTENCDLEHLPPIEKSQRDFGAKLGGWLKKKLERVLGEEDN